MSLLKTIKADIKTFRENDPAVKSTFEILLCYHTFHAILIHRLIHPLYKLNIPIIPRFISMVNRFFTGVEIHPGAEIGDGFFIDHGTGTVIGETVEIGKNCVMFQHVTLGGTGKHTGKRHPTVGKNALIGVGSTILGPVNIGNNAKIGANTFIIMKDVPANATVVGVPGKIVKINGRKSVKELKKTVVPNGFK